MPILRGGQDKSQRDIKDSTRYPIGHYLVYCRVFLRKFYLKAKRSELRWKWPEFD
jgi:hypothetical protein